MRRVVYDGSTAKQEIPAIAAEVDRDLRVVRQILRRPVEAQIVQGGLTAAQMSAMAIILSSEGLSLKDLSEQLGLAHSTVSGIVDRLVRRGFVKRQTDATDHRLTKIAVADHVREYMRDTWPSLELNPLVEALGTATPAEQQRVLQGVRTLRRLLECGA
jgi:DNA-binding MarR family transcriptional regulator